MKIDLLASKLELTSAIEEYVHTKLEKIEKLLKRFPSESVTIKAEVSKTSDHHEKGRIFRAEAHVVLPHANFYATATEEDLYAAIDKVTDELKRQLIDDKERRISNRRA